MNAGMPVRDYSIHRYVNAYCPKCFEEDPQSKEAALSRNALLIEKDTKVYLNRACQKHGWVSTLYEENYEILKYLEEWTAPTKWVTPDSVNNFEAIPFAYTNGLGELQTQHTCILLEDINENCNLSCPTCFTASSPKLTGVAPLEEIMGNIDQRLTRENGKIDVLMLSGGEPTIHPQFNEILENCITRNITRIIVNTNGIEIARNDEMLKLFKKHNDRIEVYLQFDGISKEAHKHHRNVDLREVKKRAIERLTGAEVFVVLTMTVALGVNDNEIGDVIKVALDTPFVSGVSIQPQFGSGRSNDIDELDRLTHTGVLSRFEEQTNGLLSWKDMTSLPCSHPHCCSVGYVFETDDGDWKSLVELVGEENLKKYLGLFSNTFANGELSKEIKSSISKAIPKKLTNALLNLLSEQTTLTDPKVGDLFSDICEHCNLGISDMANLARNSISKKRIRKLLAHKAKRIVIKPFMDINTMLEERLMQCCVHVGTKSKEDLHQCAPFCAVQAWPWLSEQRLSTSAGHGEVIPLTKK
jgi:uncharacterized radical SAM superfamily Fe-S cluster-containing enzyme